MIDLSRFVRPGDSVLWGQGAAQPRALTAALFAQQDQLGPLTGIVGTILTEIAPETLRSLSLKGFIGNPAAGRLLAAGKLDILPCTVSEIPRLITRGLLAVDVVFVQVSRPDRDGRYSLGLAADYLLEAIEVARTVIAEVSPRVPFTLGEAVIEPSRFDVIVEGDLPPLELASRPPNTVLARVAANAAALIADGAVLQLGIGATPDAVLDALRGHRDLGIHSGMITDRVAELMQAGVITNDHKAVDRGITVTGTLFGTAAGLYSYADHNPAIQLRRAAYTHDLGVLARLDRFVAVNSAVEVDLTGQVNTEMIGKSVVGAVGGQLDFARGALAARAGQSLIALASTGGIGSRSRIVASLAGAAVTIPRSCADAVITEYGVAELRGLTLRERARQLISIAHPRHREELERAARSL